MKIIDGKTCANMVKQGIADEVAAILASGGRPPRLDIFLVGDREDSVSYVNSKTKTCRNLEWTVSNTSCPVQQKKKSFLA